MTEKEMIEEMAKLLTGCCKRLDEKGQPIGLKCFHGCEYMDKENSICSSFNRKEAKTLYNAGYRKIPEGSVVLTKEEWEKYQITQMDWNAIYYEGIEKARKETAREILDLLYSRMPKTQIVVEIEKRYGVKITD